VANNSRTYPLKLCDRKMQRSSFRLVLPRTHGVQADTRSRTMKKKDD
jgi:hypothetical protein